MRIWIKYGIMFISLVLIQVLILNQVQFSGYINPYMYILFILLLPISIPKYALLVFGFVMGLTIDIFMNTHGMHTSATVFIAFIRPFILNAISGREMDKSDYPGLKQYGFRWFLYYASFMVLAHHIFYFYIEIFSFSGFILTFIRGFLSSVFSIFVIVLSQYLIFSE